MPGKLVVCPTPIGNLEDITLRARRALYEADVIACEDTRRTGLLLERLEIQALRLVSYHEGNEAERARELAQRIERGDNVALVSDAGMPAISDPGYRLIRACIDRDLDLEVLPGPLLDPHRAGRLGPADAPLPLPGLPAEAHRRARARAAGDRDADRLRVAAAPAGVAAAHWPSWRRTGPRPSAASSPSSTRRSRAAPWASSPAASGTRPAARSSS